MVFFINNLFCFVEVLNSDVETIRNFDDYFDNVQDFFDFMFFLQNHDIKYNCFFLSDDKVSDVLFDSYMSSDKHFIFCFESKYCWSEI